MEWTVPAHLDIRIVNDNPRRNPSHPMVGWMSGWRRGTQMGLWLAMFNWVVLSLMGDVMAQGAVTPIRIVAFGDSLSAGYQLKADEAFPAQLERALRSRGHAVQVINAGVSGDTTGGGLDRLAWAVPADADAVIVELGANDALRGLDPALARANLDRIITAIKSQKADVLIAGMRAPRNLGDRYVAAFDSIFPDLAAKHDTLLYDFFLERIAFKPEFNLADGLHPNAKGVGEIVAGLLPKAEALIERVKQRRGAGKN